MGNEVGGVDLPGARGVQIGEGNVQHNNFGPVVQVLGPTVSPGIAPTRSAYLEQVRRIAPPDPPGLIGREAELDELARFCLDPGRRQYMWWQADAWAGKSALLSTFVLRPPPQVAGRIRIVSFFITARLAAQDTRDAFIQVLLEQLAELLGEPLPPILPEATREAFLLSLLDQAAGTVAESGGRLVLVVDGLDEDRSATAASGVHSIAGLLPADPPHGMRVIVAGRPNPPVPDDVQPWHPLRDGKTARPLASSPYAQDVRRLAGGELRRLLGGSRAEQDMLGLLAAARGGLSAPDLAELADIPLWDAEAVLNASPGRTFTRRASRWSPETSPEGYLLGHEELQNEAVRYLGESRLAGYRGRLHAWADGWRARGWPAGAPEYLLDGYFQILAAPQDLPRITACALDRVRHDRMLDVTGGDAAAMTEVRTALDHIAEQDAPDVGAALALACHRDRLADRNAHIPVGLPAVWAVMGHLPRAEALADSISDLGKRAQARAKIAGGMAEGGDYERAIAEALARAGFDPYRRVQALAWPAGLLAAAGQPEQAVLFAHAVANPYWRAELLARVTEALAVGGHHEQATVIADHAQAAARSVSDPGWRGEFLARVAGALAQAGQPQRAVAVAAAAEADARAIADPRKRAAVLAWVARALADAGQSHNAAGALSATGEFERAIAEIPRPNTGPGWQAEALALVAAALAEAGQHRSAAAAAAAAEAALEMITDPHGRAEVLARVAGPLTAAGQRQQVTAIATRAQPAARAIGDPRQRAEALAWIAGALAAAGEHKLGASAAAQAETAAHAITAPTASGQGLAPIAGALAACGRYQEATTVAGSIADPGWRAKALMGVAAALAAAGDHEQAAAAARAIAGLREQAEALAEIMGALATAGQNQQLALIAPQAEAAARAIADPREQAEALVRIAGALAAAGQRQQATAIAENAESSARSLADPRERAKALVGIAVTLAATGHPERAATVAGYAEEAVELPTVYYDDEDDREEDEWCSVQDEWHAEPEKPAAAGPSYEWEADEPRALAAVALAVAGQCQRATARARSITDPDRRAEALMQVTAALSAIGQREEAEAAARSVDNPGHWPQALAEAALALARAGHTGNARRLTAAACATGEWTVAAGPALLLDPSASAAAMAMLQMR
jgi:hypothetical protein